MKRCRVYKNAHAHPRHGLLDVLRWQLGWGPRETAAEPPWQRASPLLQSSYPVRLSHPIDGGIRLTWIGHSTFLIQHQGRNILTDPIFGNCQPSLPLAKLRRAAPPGLTFEVLPEIHDVLISHCHYDHLDAPTVQRLNSTFSPQFWLPSGLTPWFRRRRIDRCSELEWWHSAALSETIQLSCVPAQHFAARGLFDRDRTHWCGWVLRSSARSIYFAGDTGYCPTFREIGAHFGGFDLAMIPIGAYRPRWIMQPVHVDPDEAAMIHRDVRSRLSVACHWGTFALTDEPLAEPPELLARALSAQGIPPEQFRVLGFGESIEV